MRRESSIMKRRHDLILSTLAANEGITSRVVYSISCNKTHKKKSSSSQAVEFNSDS